jgi:hypothetical protein
MSSTGTALLLLEMLLAAPVIVTLELLLAAPVIVMFLHIEKDDSIIDPVKCQQQ